MHGKVNGFELESLESRILLAADLVCGPGMPAPDSDLLTVETVPTTPLVTEDLLHDQNPSVGSPDLFSGLASEPLAAGPAPELGTDALSSIETEQAEQTGTRPETDPVRMITPHDSTGAGETSIRSHAETAVRTLRAANAPPAGMLFAALESAPDETGGPKVIPGTVGPDTITISASGGTITVSAPSFTESYIFTNPGDITINAGDGNDTIVVQSLGTYTGKLTVNGQLGDDTVTLASVTTTASYEINGGGNNDTVTVAGGPNISLSDSQLTVGAKVIAISSIEFASLSGNGSAHTFTVGSWTGTVTISGGDGNDRYVLNTGFGNVTLSSPDNGIDTLDFTGNNGTLTVSANKAVISSSTGGTLAQSAVAAHQAEEIDILLTAAAITQLENVFVKLDEFALRLNSISQLAAQLPVLSRAIEGSLGKLIRLGQVFTEIKEKAVAAMTSATKLSQVVDLLNGMSLALPAPPFGSSGTKNFSSNYRGSGTTAIPATASGQLEALIDFSFFASGSQIVQLDLGHEAQLLGLSIEADFTVTTTLAAALTFGLTTETVPAAFLVPGGSLDLTVNATANLTNVAINLGFLSAKITSGSITLGGTVHLVLNDVGATDHKVLLSELTNASLSSLVSVSVPSTHFSATLPVTLAPNGGTSNLQIAGMSGDVDSATFKLELPALANVFSGAIPTFSLLSNTSPAKSLLDFSNITPSEAIGMLARVANSLAALSGSNVLKTEIPFSGGKTLGDVLDYATTFKKKILDPLFTSGDALRPDNDGNGTMDLKFSSIQTLLNQLITALGLPANTLKAAYDPATKLLTFNLNFSRTLSFAEARLQERKTGGTPATTEFATTNEIQTLTINATGGTFRLAFPDNQGLLQFTSDLGYNAPATGVGSVQSALETLDGIGTGAVSVTKSGSVYTITFQGSLANTDVQLLTSDANDLTGASFPINFGASLGDFASVTTTGSFGISASLTTSLTFGFDLNPSQTVELTPPLYSTAATVIIERPVGVTGTDNQVQYLTIANAKAGNYRLQLGSSTTADIAWNANESAIQAELSNVGITGTSILALNTVTVGNQKTFKITFATNPSALLAVLPANAPANYLKGTANTGQLSGNGTFNLSLFNQPAVQIVTRADGKTGTDEIQWVTLLNATGGTFKLGFPGTDGKVQFTEAIQYNAAPAVGSTSVRARLEDLTGIGSGNVTVTTSADGKTYHITFTGSKAGINVAQLTVISDGLVNATAFAGPITITVNQADTTSNESPADLQKDVQSAVNTKLATEGLTVGFLSGSEFRTSALTTTAAAASALYSPFNNAPGKRIASDIEFTIKVVRNPGLGNEEKRDITGVVRLVDLLDNGSDSAGQMAGSLLKNDGSLDSTELSATVSATSLAAKLQKAINAALATAGYGGDKGFHVVIGATSEKLTFDVNAVPGKVVPGASDTVEVVFGAPVTVEAGGGRIAFSTPPLTVSMFALEPAVNVDRVFQLTIGSSAAANFSDPAYQELGLLTAPTRMDGTTTRDIKFTLVVNGVESGDIAVAAATRSSIGALVSAIQSAVDTGLAARINPETGLAFAGGSVLVFQVEQNGVKGNRIGFRAGPGVSKLAMNVPKFSSGSTINGAITELGYPSGSGETKQAKATRFFLDNVNLIGNVALTASDVSATASIGFLGVTGTGHGTLGSDKFVDLTVSFGLKNPVTGGSKVTVDVLTSALGKGKFLYKPANVGGTNENPGTGIVDGSISGGLGFNLTISPAGGLSGLDSLSASLDIHATSPNWFVAPPSISNPLGFANKLITLTGTATFLQEVAPADGKLTKDVNFLVTDGTHTASGHLLAKETSGFTTRTELKNALETAIGSAVADFITAGGAPGTAIAVTTDDSGKLGLTGNNGVQIRGPIIFQGPDLDAILERFRNLSFTDIIAGLRVLINYLRSLNGSDGGSAIAEVLNTKIPLIDRSLSDMLNVADKLSERIEAIASDPSGSVQALEQLLRSKLGLPAGPPILFLDMTGPSGPILTFTFSFSAAANLSRPFSLDLTDAGLPSFLTDIVGVSASGNLNVNAKFDFDLKLGLDLTAPDRGFFFVTGASGTKLTATAVAAASGLAFNAQLGPFGLFVRGGTASLKARIDLSLHDKPQNRLNILSLPSGGSPSFSLPGLSDLNIQFPTTDGNNAASASLPLYFGTEDNLVALGAPNILGATINLVKVFNPNAGGQVFTFVTPTFDFGQLLRPSLFTLLSNPSVVIDGLDRLLLTLQEALSGQIMGAKLPFVGDLLQNNPASSFIEDFRDDLLKPLANVLRENNVTFSGLVTLIKDTIYGALGPSSPAFGSIGGLLKKSSGIPADSANDIGFKLILPNGSSTTDLAQLLSAQAAQIDFDLGKVFDFAAPEIAFDLGIPVFGIEAEFTPHVRISFNLHIGFGVDKDKGFYVVTNYSTPEVTADVKVYFSSITFTENAPTGVGARASVNGRLLFLGLKITDGVDLNDNSSIQPDEISMLSLGGSVDIRDPGTGTNADGKLTLGELTSSSLTQIIQAELTGAADLRAHAVVDFSTLDPSLGKVLPSISTDLLAHFGLKIGSTTGYKLRVDPPAFALANITLDLGSFISDFAAPILDGIKKVLDPFKFLIGPDGFLNKRIPLLSDLAGRTITGKDLIKVFDPDHGPQVVAFLDFVQQLYFIIDLVDGAKSEGAVKLHFGNLILADSEPQPYFTASLSDHLFGSGLSGLGPLQNIFAGGSKGAMGDLRSLNLNSLKNAALSPVQDAKSQGTEGSKTKTFKAGVTKPGGIDFPLLSHPENIFKLLMGQDVTLFLVKLPEFGFDFFYRQEFPIIGPLVGFFGGGVGGGISLSFGYDTRGLSQFLASKNASALLNGFFISDLDEKGTDVPEAFLKAQITVGAGISLGLIKAGVEGGITATILFNFADLDADGKIRFDELGQNVLANDGNPLAIFDISGNIQFFLRAFVEINLFITKIKLEFEFVRVTLFEFNIPFKRPAVLASQTGDTLTLNIGPNAANRLRGNISDIAESIKVEGTSSGIVVWSDDSQFNLGHAAAALHPFYGVKKIVVDGGVGNDVIDLSGVTDASIVVTVTAGDGDDIVIGGAGDDKLSGGPGNDVLIGNGGKDILDGGAGNDKLFGDGVPATFAFGGIGPLPGSVPNPFTVTGTAGNDELRGGEGDDYLHGGPGVNKYWGGADNDKYQRSSGADIFELADFGSVEEIDGAGMGDTLDFSSQMQNLTFFLRKDGSDLRIEAGFNPIAGMAGTSISHFNSQLIVHNANGISTIKGSDLVDTFHVYETTVAGITLNGAKGNDRYFFYIGSPAINVTVNDQGNAWDSDNLIEVIGTTSGDVITITGDQIDPATSGTGLITLSGSQAVSYVAPVASANVLQIKIRGEAGDDTIGVASTAWTVPVRVDAGAGNDKITIGNNTGGVDDIKGYLRPGLNAPFGLGPVVLVGGSGHDSVIVNDAADTSANVGNINAFLEKRQGIAPLIEVGVVSGLDMILNFNGSATPGRVEFEGFEALDVRLGTGADQLSVGGGFDLDKTSATGGKANAELFFGGTPTEFAKGRLIDRESGHTLEQDLNDTAKVGIKQVIHTISGMTLIATGAGDDQINVIATNILDRDVQNGNLNLVSGSTAQGGNSASAVNEIQTVTVQGKARGEGYFTISYRFQETRPLAFGASQNEVQNALVELYTIGKDALEQPNVAVVKTAHAGNDVYTITFQNGMAGQDVEQMTPRIIPLLISGGAGVDRLHVQELRERAFFLGGSGDDFVKVNVNVTSGANPVSLDPAVLVGNGLNAEITLDGQDDSDNYQVHLVGGTTASLVHVVDSGTTGFDRLIVYGTDLPDLFLLRSAAAEKGLAFVGMINTDPAKLASAQPVERVNYNINLEEIIVEGRNGDDQFYADDTRAVITIHAGKGNDFFQVGQLYKTTRIASVLTGIAEEDAYATIETTKGWLSNGISQPMTINGDDGEDLFIVFHNLAVLTLNGGADDDTFIIQAFALAGSQDDKRALTNLSGDAGADTVMYAVNAPVNIDGGDGFDTLIIIGTEFKDDFVVTDRGVFGAGLNVNFVGIELLEVDGAEGDDRFFIQGTGSSFMTRITGGLGTDLFSINGQTPRNGVISNDLRGHTGLITHSVVSGDLNYEGLKVIGISSNVADNDEPAIIVTESDGFSQVIQGIIDPAVGLFLNQQKGLIDTYTVMLSRPPRLGKTVTVTAAPPKGLVLLDALLAPIRDAGGNAIGTDLVFNEGNWYLPQQVRFAVDGSVTTIPDSAVIQHRITADDLITGTVSMAENGEFDPSNTLLDAKLIDAIANFQSIPNLPEHLRGAYVTITDSVSDPSAVGQVRMILSVVDSHTLILDRAWTVVPGSDAKYQIRLFSGVNIPNVRADVFAGNKAAIVLRQTQGTTRVTEYDTAAVSLSEALTRGAVDTIELRLSAAPSGPVTLTLDGGGQLEFLDGTNAVITALTFTVLNYDRVQTITVRAINDAVVEGFHKADLKLSAIGGGYSGVSQIVVADIADDDYAGVQILESNGSTDAIEFSDGLFGVSAAAADATNAPWRDTYQVVLTKEPTTGVIINILAEPTRTSRTGGIRSFIEQVEVSTNNSNFSFTQSLIFTVANWNVPQTVYVRAVDDARVDGGDTKVFAPALDLLNKIQGPLFIAGGEGEDRTGLTEREPIMLPPEKNERLSMGEVQAATEAAGLSTPATMTINPADLSADELLSLGISAPLIMPSQLKDLSIEITQGLGKNKVRIITGGTLLGNGDWELTLNHGWFSPFPYPGNASVPGSGSQFTLFVTNPNLLVQEDDSTDILWVNDTDNVNRFDDPAKTPNPFGEGRLFFDASLFGRKVDVTTIVNGGPVLGGGVPNRNEVQRLTVKAIAGAFTLTFGNQTTDPGAHPLNWNATAIEIQSALAALPNIGAGNVSVTAGSEAGVFTVTFLGALAGADQPKLRADTTALTGGAPLNKFRIIGFGMGADRNIGGVMPSPGGITFEEIENLTINLGPNNNRFTIDNTPAATATTLNTHGGDDVVLVRKIQGHTWINGGSGSDTITVSNAHQKLSDLLGLLTVSGDIPQVLVEKLAQGSPADGPSVNAVNEVQQITVEATGGTFTLSHGGQVTVPIDFDAPATGLNSVQQHLEALSTIGAGNVQVSKAGNVYRVTFLNGKSGQPVNLLGANDANLRNGWGSTDTLNLDDNGNASASTGVLTSSSLTGLSTRQVNEVQSLVLNATQGSFKLSFNGYVSMPLSFDVSAAALQLALENLPGSPIKPGDVAVTRNDDVYVVRFQGNLGNQDVAELVAINFDLKRAVEEPGGGNAYAPTPLLDGSAHVFTRVQGTDSPSINDLQALTINATNGSYRLRLLNGTGAEFTTADIPFDASADVVRQALQDAWAGSDDVETRKFAVTVDKYIVDRGPIHEAVYLIGFQGKLRQVRNGPGVDLLRVLSGSTPLGGSAVVTIRMDGVNYYGVENLNIDFGSNNDTLNVQGTTAGSKGFAMAGGVAVTNIRLHAGNEQAFVSSKADLDFDSAPGFDFLTGDVQDLRGSLNIDFGSGRHKLMVSDEASTIGDTDVRIVDVAAKLPNSTPANLGLSASADIWITGLTPGTGYLPSGGFAPDASYLTSGISYRADSTGNFYDGVLYWTGSGNDTVYIDGTHRRAGERTMTLLSTGVGNDSVTVNLTNGQDDFFALNTTGGAHSADPSLLTGTESDNDAVDASASTLPLIIFGGLGNDLIQAGQGTDIVFGDFGRVHYAGLATASPGTESLIAVLGFGGRGDKVSSQIVDPRWVFSRHLTLGGSDTVRGLEGDDILIGGAIGDEIDGNQGNDLIFGDAVQLFRRDITVGTVGDITDPRFATLRGSVIYSRTDLSPSQLGSAVPGATNSGEALVDGLARDYRNQDGSTVAWAEYRIERLYHSSGIESASDNSFGDDYIAGGAGNDVIFGQLGDDIIQGDGSITRSLTGNARVGASRGPANELLLQPSFESVTDGDDYIEGGGGKDVIFGGLGQDDLIGGSSSLFTLTTRDLRPDDSDILFGGAGTRIDRNHLLDSANQGSIVLNERHARDSDVIVGDNGKVYRLVGTGSELNGTAASGFLQFNYDQTFGTPSKNFADGEDRGAKRIIPRAVSLLDYTVGGPSFDAANAAHDIGAADEVHGESGDDFIYGGKGHDVLFGDSEDDDIIGGYGNDWISGGTGQDGVIGDDGRIFTSRNATAEPLHGIGVTTESPISTPGKMQQAVINVTGALKKAVDLTPFSADPGWTATADEFAATGQPHGYDDIIFGGLGSDFLHGGSGDDAISGAEALTESYIVVANTLVRSDFSQPCNPGNALNYDATATKFGQYDAYEPLRKILLNADATLSKTNGVGQEWFLNFSANEGSPAQNSNKKTDGNDAIFGDNGNDWLVGGTGRDNLYGGWGNDLLNADDDLGTGSGQNNTPDTDTSYEDRAYGGAGLDVLIANTGGDRLIDWVGEFNSYLVPFAPFGAATVSRALQPQLPVFLYALSASDGADATRPSDGAGEQSRNGEPSGELGVVLQKDFAWQTQTGSPRDPQAGNVHGGQRDVLRSASFDDGTAQSFFPDSGTWTVTGGRFEVAPTSLGGDAVSVFDVNSYIPAYFELLATINAGKPTAGSKANAYLIFDYQSPTDFKFAGINASTNKLEMGHRTAEGWMVDKQAVYTSAIKSGTDYNLLLALNGTTATLTVNNQASLSFTFPTRTDASGFEHGLNDGMVGIGANNAKAQIDNVVVQRVPLPVSLSQTVDFSSGPTALFQAPQSGTWRTTSESRYLGTTATPEAPAINLLDVRVAPAYMLDLAATFQTQSQGGIVFDQSSSTDFKFVLLSTDTKQLIIGHRTSKGWFTDASSTVASLAGNEDFTLGVFLKGNTVTTTVNGKSTASFAYNELLNDGGFGLISRETSSFKKVVVNTDDPSAAIPEMLAILNTVVNRAPVAINDAASTTRNTAVTISVLSNDSDPDQNPLTIIALTQPGSGTVVLNPDGTIGYTPKRNFTGTNTFTYKLTDGFAQSDTASVTVTVTG